MLFWIRKNKYRFGLILSALGFILNNFYADLTHAFVTTYPTTAAAIIDVGGITSGHYYLCTSLNVVCVIAAILFIFASVENGEW